VIPSPAQVRAQFNEFVVGQEDAKRTLAAAMVSHYRMVEYSGDVRIGKSNVLMLGPTGSGKTYLVQVAARLFQVPFAQINATAITPSGWAGADPESVIVDLWRRAKAKKIDWQSAQRGIVYIDEIDKLAAKKDQHDPTAAGAGGFSTIQIQQALLKVIEGTQVTVDGNPFSTDNVLFIASGAFVGLEQIIHKRQAGGRFTRSLPPPNILRFLEVRDLLEYGFIPEFAGRFPVSAVVQTLTEGEMIAILRDVKDSLLAQEQAKLSVTGCTLEFDEETLRLIVRQALTQGTGARGLRTILAKRLEPILDDLEPDTDVLVTSAGVHKNRRRVASEGSSLALEPPPAFTGESTAAAPEERTIAEKLN
jgi:ATP-dependent Clp protease ATP-binding subunit ClpX